MTGDGAAHDEPNGRGDDWVSVHVYRAGPLDPLVNDLVGPLFREARADGGWAARAFFERYWEGGTHVRLRLRVRPGHDREAATAWTLRRCRAYLVGNPSTLVASQAEYGAFAARVARWESLPAVARTLRPNNTVKAVPYRPEHERYGHGAALRAAETHFAESSAIALYVLGTTAVGPADPWRGTLGCSLLLSAWLCTGETPRALAERITVRPEALNALPGGAGRHHLADWERRYRRRRDSLDALCREVIATAAVPAPEEGGSTLDHWRRSLTRLHSVLAGEIAAGVFRPPKQGRQGGPADGTGTGNPSTGDPSAGDPSTGGTGAGEGTLPVLDLCAHLLCNRLGIGLEEEFYLRFLAGRALSGVAEEVPA